MLFVDCVACGRILKFEFRDLFCVIDFFLFSFFLERKFFMSKFEYFMSAIMPLILLCIFYLRIFKPMILPKLRMKKAAKSPEIRAQATLISKTKELEFRSYNSPTVLYLVF